MLSIRDIVGSFSISFDVYRKIAKRFSWNEHGILAMLRSLLLVPLKKTSGRGVARTLKDDKELAKVCGFKKKTPDQSWIHRFRDQIADLLPEIFSELVAQLRQKGAIDGKDWSIDATHVEAYANKHKKKKADTDASWGYKNSQKKWFFGYKAHLVCDSKQELPIGYTVTTGRVHDSQPANPLLDETYQQTKLVPERVRGDGAYNSTSIRENIRHYGALDDIPHKGEARKKKNENKRASIEHINSRQKEHFGLNDLKLRGLTKVMAHVGLCLIAQLQTALTNHAKGFNIRQVIHT